MVTEFYREIIEKLNSAGVEYPDFEADILCETVFGRSFKLDMLMERLNPTDEDISKLEALVERRISGEPLQYIVGSWEFYGIDFKVGEGVLIPRQDTEVLVDVALEFLDDKNAPHIVDLCSGTGCIPIAIALYKTDAKAYALELYDKAYGYLCTNCSEHTGVEPMQRDVLSEATAGEFSRLDLITANPPYLTRSDMNELQNEVGYEPSTALFGGNDGLDYYREISRIWKPSLKAGGMILFEVGVTQSEAVAEILRLNGYENIKIYNDFTDRPRAVSGTSPNFCTVSVLQ